MKTNHFHAIGRHRADNGRSPIRGGKHRRTNGRIGLLQAIIFTVGNTTTTTVQTVSSRIWRAPLALDTQNPTCPDDHNKNGDG